MSYLPLNEMEGFIPSPEFAKAATQTNPALGSFPHVRGIHATSSCLVHVMLIVIYRVNQNHSPSVVSLVAVYFKEMPMK